MSFTAYQKTSTNGQIVSQYPEVIEGAAQAQRIVQMLNGVAADDIGFWIPAAPFLSGTLQVESSTSLDGNVQLLGSNDPQMPGNGWVLTIGGTPTENDELTVALGSDVGGLSVVASYKVLSTDTLGSITLGLAAAIQSALNATNYINSGQDAAIAAGGTQVHAVDIEEETCTVSGTPNPTDVVAITVTNADLSGGAETGSYTVQADDTNDLIAAGLAAALNAISDFASNGFAATATGAVVKIVSTNKLTTAYSKTQTSGTTLTLADASTRTISIYTSQAFAHLSILTSASADASETITITQYDSGLGVDIGSAITEVGFTDYSGPYTWLKLSVGSYSSGRITALLQQNYP